MDLTAITKLVAMTSAELSRGEQGEHVFFYQCWKTLMNGVIPAGYEKYRHPGTGQEQQRVRVVFKTKFGPKPPMVHCSPSGIDWCQFPAPNTPRDNNSLRLAVKAVNIMVDGFDLVANTWGGTNMFTLSVEWVAIPQ